MNRRRFLHTSAALASVHTLLQAAGAEQARAGICSFSAHLHWQAARAGKPGVKFRDAAGFYAYGRELGADGVQTSLRELDPAALKALRERVERDGSRQEGDVRLPKTAADLDVFEREVRLTREAGATVARAVLMGGRRYEVFKSMDEFRAFHEESRSRLALAEPVLKKHQLKLAVENHKDLTLDEQLALLHGIGSEWIGALVDTGNNIALLDDPYHTIERLAPLAFSVHLKDMAVQPATDGFLLSEVPCGTGFLDLPRIIRTLAAANPALLFNLEMATRDPLHVPCLTDTYWVTFPDRKATHLAPALGLVKANPIKQPPPSISGKPLPEQLAEEEQNNRASLAWMQKHLRA